MSGMFDRTGPCPYTERCESFQTIRRAESWIEHELVGIRKACAQGDASIDEMDWAQVLEKRMDHMRRVKERCYGFNNRCLRFWQFRGMERKEREPQRVERDRWLEDLYEKDWLRSEA